MRNPRWSGILFVTLMMVVKILKFGMLLSTNRLTQAIMIHIHVCDIVTTNVR